MQALKGEDITIYGDGTQTRSFCYVDDLVDGMTRMMNSRDDFTGPVNLGNPNEITMIQLAEIFLRHSRNELLSDLRILCNIPAVDVLQDLHIACYYKSMGVYDYHVVKDKRLRRIVVKNNWFD